jgi:hypothetical protein
LFDADLGRTCTHIYDNLRAAFHILKSNGSLFILTNPNAKYIICSYLIITLALCFEYISQNKFSGILCSDITHQTTLASTSDVCTTTFNIMNKWELTIKGEVASSGIIFMQILQLVQTFLGRQACRRLSTEVFYSMSEKSGTKGNFN